MNLDSYPTTTDVLRYQKGVPPTASLGTVCAADFNWSLLNEDLAFPVAVIRRRILEHNARIMQQFIDRQGVWLYPHGKTSMCPAIFDVQLEHGARGITVANVLQAEVAITHGIKSVFIANQVVGRQDIIRLKQILINSPECTVYLIVDSLENLRRLNLGLSNSLEKNQVFLLMEIGVPGGRTGVRTFDEAISLAQNARSLNLTFRGLEAFEGIFDPDKGSVSVKLVQNFLQRVTEIFSALEERSLFGNGELFLSAGGSSYYDIVSDVFGNLKVNRTVHTIIRSGCYVAHDDGMCQRALSFIRDRKIVPDSYLLEPALEVWAQIQSRPEPALAFANAGMRDLSSDKDLPLVRKWYRPGHHKMPAVVEKKEVTVKALNDHHTHLTLDQSCQLAVGDLIACGISHPCTTFDKWKYIFFVDEKYRVISLEKTWF